MTLQEKHQALNEAHRAAKAYAAARTAALALRGWPAPKRALAAAGRAYDTARAASGYCLSHWEA